MPPDFYTLGSFAALLRVNIFDQGGPIRALVYVG